MPKSLTVLGKSFASIIQSLEKTRAKVEMLHASGKLLEQDVEHVYAGLFLKAFTEFESLIEQVFMALLTNERRSSRSTTVRLVEIRPKARTHEILFEGKKYLDWLPLEKHTYKRAERFLNNGEPFSLLNSAEKKL